MRISLGKTAYGSFSVEDDDDKQWDAFREHVRQLDSLAAALKAEAARVLEAKAPALNPAQAESKKVHDLLTNVFGDEEDTMEELDSEMLGFVQRKKLPTGPEAQVEADRMQGVVERHGAILAATEVRAAHDPDLAAQLQPYRQWSNNLVGRVETKIEYLRSGR